MLRRVLALVVPPACLACGAPLRADRDLCAACRATLPWLGRDVCPRCALPLPCGRCPAEHVAWDAAWAPLAHDGPARALVAALKFRGTLAAAQVMAAQMAAGCPFDLQGAAVVPVPALPARRSARGFDHAAILASAVARRSAAGVVACLRRAGSAERQLGAGRATRRAKGRIVVRCPRDAPARAVLVDDVHTTGATLDACARALRRAGAAEVRAITYTRTLP